MPQTIKFPIIPLEKPPGGVAKPTAPPWPFTWILAVMAIAVGGILGSYVGGIVVCYSLSWWANVACNKRTRRKFRSNLDAWRKLIRTWKGRDETDEHEA